MAKHHGWRRCDEEGCDIQCTPMNFVDFESKRYCLWCWVKKNNPNHPELDQIEEKVRAEAEVWRCQKHTRDENGLPDGPKSVRSQGNRVNNP